MFIAYLSTLHCQFSLILLVSDLNFKLVADERVLNPYHLDDFISSFGFLVYVFTFNVFCIEIL